MRYVRFLFSLSRRLRSVKSSFLFSAKRFCAKRRQKVSLCLKGDIPARRLYLQIKHRRVILSDSENYSKRGLYMQTFLLVALCARCFADCHLRENLRGVFDSSFIDAPSFSPFFARSPTPSRYLKEGRALEQKNERTDAITESCIWRQK